MHDFGISSPGIKTILIVDDSVENLQLLNALLKDDHRIKVAKNGLKALEILRRDPVDLVLMDVIMPEMDGFTACQHIKDDPSIRHIPVIFLTALKDANDETKGFNCGGADFISKPFHPEIVKARIKTHLDLQEERRKSDALLKILLPEEVIKQLKAKGSYAPEIHPATSIMFCDLVGFTEKASSIDPQNLVNELTDLFTSFDEIAYRNQALRIKTIGDAYLAATGVANPSPAHAQNLVDTGLQILDYLKERNKESPYPWECRIGIHSGQIISGIVGKARCQFDIMGDNVNIAARVEENGPPMKVTITEASSQLLSPDVYRFQSLGKIAMKGKGEMHLLTVERIAKA